MAEFDTTKVRESGFKGYAKQGIRDNSKAIDTASKFDAISGFAKLGLDTAVDIKEKSVLEDVQGSIEGLSTEVTDRSLEGVQTLSDSIVNDQENLVDVKDNAGYDGTYPTALDSDLHEDVSGITASLQEKADKLTRAKNQGVMTEFELSQRLAKITREAVAANPAFSAEIIARANQTSTLNNLTARVKQDVNALSNMASVQEAADKKLVTEALKHDIDIYNPNGSYQLPDGSLNKAAVAQELSTRQVKKSMLAEYETAKKTNSAVQGLNAQELMSTGKPVLLNDAVVFGLDAKYQDVLNGTGSPSEKLLVMERLAQGELFELQNFYVKNGVPVNDPNAKMFLEQADKRMKAMQKVYTDRVTGKIDAETAKASLDYLQNSEEYRLYKDNPGLHSDLTVIKAIKGFSPINSHVETLKIQNRVLDSLKEKEIPETVGNPKNKQPNTNFDKATGKQSGMSMSTVALAEVVEEDDTALEEFGDVLESRLAYANNYSQYVDKDIQAQEYQQVIKDFNNPKVASAVENLNNPQLNQSWTDTIESNLPVVKNGYKRYMDMNKGKELVARGDNLVVKNAKLEDRNFIQNDLKTINEQAKAWSLFTGQDVSEYHAMVMDMETKDKEA